MLPVRIENSNVMARQPTNWDESRQGPCGSLAVRFETIGDIGYMCSAWEPEPDEVLHLVAGGKIMLGVSAPQHPVVRMSVGPVPEQLTRSTLIREEIDARGNLTVVAETLFPPLPGADPATAQQARCQVVIGAGGAPRASMIAMSEIEKLAIERGWIAA